MDPFREFLSLIIDDSILFRDAPKPRKDGFAEAVRVPKPRLPVERRLTW